MSGFEKINLSEIQEESKRLNEPAGNQSDYLDKFLQLPKVPPGKTVTFSVRILPPAKGKKLFQYTRIHNINNRRIQCPRPLLDNGKWDRTVYNPIADYYGSLYNKADKMKKAGASEAEIKDVIDEAIRIKPNERYYYNVIARKVVNKDGVVELNVGPKIASFGKILHKKIIKALCGGEGVKAIGDVTDPMNGFDFDIVIEQRGEYPNYDSSSFQRDSTPLGTTEEINRWAANLHDLSALRVPATAEQLDKEFAIYRKLIADDRLGFDVETFDQKYKSNGSVLAQTEQAVQSEATSHEAEMPVTSGPTPDEDISINDADFMKELQELE
jgi:hypothetical protein